MFSVTGTAMVNLANTHYALGRYKDAMLLQEKAIQFWRREMPENHPSFSHVGA
jgi:hypothetical protein